MHNWKCAIKLAAVTDLPLGKAAAEFRLQALGNHLHQIRAIIRPFFTALFFFKNPLTNMPVHHGALVIDRAHRLLTRLGDDGFDVVD